jgi:dienelactone hydrolase
VTALSRTSDLEMPGIVDVMSRAASLVLAGLTAACGSEAAPDLSVEAAGRHTVGTSRLEASVGGRPVIVQAWYPTDAAPAAVAIEQLEAEPRRTDYAGLLAAAGPCPTRSLEVAVDAPPLAGPFPVVVGSHCHSCTRLSNAASSVRLASHGFVVLTVDHAGDSLWDQLAGTPGSLDAATLQQRVDDLGAALALDAPALVGADLGRIGVFGHSFGGVTAGRLAQLDPRIRAAASLAAPMENPLIPGVTLAQLTPPLLFFVAVEDNSITELGNNFIRDNFDAAPGPAWKLEMADAGHWSVSDLAGLVPLFAAGCGDGIRQTTDEPFSYIDPATARDVTAAYLTAFFRATLDDDAGARAYLERSAGPVTAAHRD